MSDAAYRRWVNVNLPHARTVLARIGRSLEALGVLGESPGAGGSEVRPAFELLEAELADFDEDPSFAEALRAADIAAEHGRALVAAILETSARGDRLGQHVRNLFECLGLADEGAALALQCGEPPDSLLR